MTAFQIAFPQQGNWWRRCPPSTSCSSSLDVAYAPRASRPEALAEWIAETAFLTYVQSGNRQFHLRRALAASIRKESGVWSCQEDHLGVMGYGDSREKALADFMEDFAVAYDGLVGKPDSLLTEDARELRDVLANMVARINPVESGSGKEDQGDQVVTRGTAPLFPGV